MIIFERLDVSVPNLSSTSPHKMSPRSTPCIFLDYPPNHRGYRCLNLANNKVLISRHVIFDEGTFPNSSQYTPKPSDFGFFDDESSPNSYSPLFISSATQPSFPSPSAPHSPPLGPSVQPTSKIGPTSLSPTRVSP